MVEGLPSIKFSNGTCKGCVVGKHAERSYEKGKSRTLVQVLDLVQSNLTGPLPTPYYGGLRYVFPFLYDFSRNFCVYFLKLKYEVFETLKVWKALVENACGNKINFFRSENCKEYVKNIFHHICE